VTKQPARTLPLCWLVTQPLAIGANAAHQAAYAIPVNWEAAADRCPVKLRSLLTKMLLRAVSMPALTSGRGRLRLHSLCGQDCELKLSARLAHIQIDILQTAGLQRHKWCASRGRRHCTI